jgi:GT2 family glycosyltransferase
MQPIVVIATKGRSKEVYELLSWLEEQTLQALHTFVIGVDPSDIDKLDQHSLTLAGRATVKHTSNPGSAIQRNDGIDLARSMGLLESGDYFISFFDDDFRPEARWLEEAQKFFMANPDVVGLTGHVVADGVHGENITSSDARAYLRGERPPHQHWASGDDVRPLDCLYGCNMAFTHKAISQCRFDEALPLYGWQEDQDFTGQASRLGRNVYIPFCKGVHLGTKSGRTSGLRFGYSQIANPVYLIKKGTMPKRKAYKFMFKYVLANTAKSLINHPLVDYPGRLKGNLLALRDLLTGRCDPRRILELG